MVRGPGVVGDGDAAEVKRFPSNSSSMIWPSFVSSRGRLLSFLFLQLRSLTGC